MIFLEENGCMETEKNIILEMFHNKKYLQSLYELSEKSYEEILNLSHIPKDCIPIGSIEFVRLCLEKMGYSDRLKPIEIPDYLQTKVFVKRKYLFLKGSDVKQLSGQWFVKDAETLKGFSGVFDFNKQCDLPVLKDECVYLVCEPVEILSEWRVYVISGRIENISNYNGDPLHFPDKDLIQQAVSRIKFQEKSLRSYTIDVMVTKHGTELIEIHNFVSIGLYSCLWGDNLIQGYIDGIDYEKNNNKEQ